ncbi:MAG: hypothetical protein LC650_00620 [Actinobacteria bacterium]|nr:hypothetical protein [Actinomycetota bacterium]
MAAIVPSATEAIDALVNVLHDPEANLDSADRDIIAETIGLLAEVERGE